MSQVPDELTNGGDPAEFGVAIDSIITTNGTKVQLPRAGVTVVVGGNNVGKTTFLNEIEGLLAFMGEQKQPNLIVSQLHLFKSGTIQDLSSWLSEHTPWKIQSGISGFVGPDGHILHRSAFESQWQGQSNTPGSLMSLARLLVHKGDVHQRLQWIHPQPLREDIANPPAHPLHKLEDDHHLLEEMRNLHKRIFRESLTLDRLSRNVQLRVGETPIPAPTIDAVTGEYRNALVSLPPLHMQGDGMKSLVGLLMPIVTGQYPVMIVDEPEAFLHPPQANVLGRILGELAQKRQVQIILATHDRNLLVGLLESQAPVSVVRLDRQGPGTKVHQLDPSNVRELWNDPVLRYTNVLDGLFHRVVVLTEGDRDCRFFRASLDAYDEGKDLPFAPNDVLFVPAGGKDGFPKMISALRGVSVPLIVVPDLDILNDETKIKKLVQSTGKDWNTFAHDYKLATEQFRQARADITRGQALELIRPILNESPTLRLDKQTAALVKAVLRTDRSPWQDLKDYGVRAFRSQTTSAFKLLSELNTIGIVPVREGELERLAPNVESRKGAGWIEEALRSQAHHGDVAQAHMEEIVTAIGSVLIST